MNLEQYEVEEEKNGLMYSFISRGHKDIIKLIAYSPLNRTIQTPKGELNVFNLGFGDKIGNSFNIDDKANSNNGDTHRVFNTVLNTIPSFFKFNSNSCLFVTGSDERRKRTYCYYVSKNLDRLSATYAFYGLTSNNGLVKFVKGEQFEGVVFYELNP